MGRVTSSDRHAERGNQIIEFALLVPVMITVLMLAVDGGRLMTAYNAVKNASREAAHYAATEGIGPVTDCDGTISETDTIKLAQVIENEGSGLLKANKVTCITVTDTPINLVCGWCSSTSPPQNQKVRAVHVRYQFEFINPVLSRNPITIYSDGAWHKP